MKAIILSVLLLTACTKNSTLTKNEMGLTVKDVQMEISHLDEIEWKVGKNREETLSQSFAFIVDMPRITEEDLEHLTKARGIDSWIIRLIHEKGSQKLDLGSLYARFKPKQIIRGQVGGAPTSVTMKVFYAAAYASERFRSFNCPAMNHSFRIDKLRINGDSQPFDLTIGQISPYPEKSHLVELTPSAFNGGNSLKGEYFIEIAPYDSERKLIHAAFKRIPRSVEVVGEKTEVVNSCLGVHPELIP